MDESDKYFVAVFTIGTILFLVAYVGYSVHSFHVAEAKFPQFDHGNVVEVPVGNIVPKKIVRADDIRMVYSAGFGGGSGSAPTMYTTISEFRRIVNSSSVVAVIDDSEIITYRPSLKSYVAVKAPVYFNGVKFNRITIIGNTIYLIKDEFRTDSDTVLLLITGELIIGFIASLVFFVKS